MSRVHPVRGRVISGQFQHLTHLTPTRTRMHASTRPLPQPHADIRSLGDVTVNKALEDADEYNDFDIILAFFFPFVLSKQEFPSGLAFSVRC